MNKIITYCACTMLNLQLNAQVNPIDSTTVWDMWMTWNPTLFQNTYPQIPFVQNGNSAGGVFWVNGRATMINTSQNNILQGTLPSTIGNLSELTFIDLRVNPNLTGSIPPELGLLSNLQKLFISGCGFTGSIPSEIGNISNLEDLNLGNPGVGGIIPPTFINLNKLKWFSLVNSDVKEDLPGYFGLLDSLISININQNPSFGNLLSDSLCLSNSLQEIILLGNHFYGPIPPCLGTMPTLIGLNISRSHFSGAIPQSLCNPVRPYFWLVADSTDIDSLPLIPPAQTMTLWSFTNNNIQFGDFENNYFNGCWSCINYIAPQKPVWSLLDTTVLINTTITLNSTVSGQYNTYNWYKNGTFLGSNNTGLWIIPTIQYSDSGVYTCSITNQYITPERNLILDRWPITLHVVNSFNTTEILNTNLNPEVFPNPFNQTLTVKLKAMFNEQTTLTLINASGETVMQAKTQACEYVFNTEKLLAGLYLLKAETGRTVTTFKIRKE